jgi:YD repeat-containing protein
VNIRVSTSIIPAIICIAAANFLTDTDATGATTASTYNAQNKLASTTDARASKTSYEYAPKEFPLGNNARSELSGHG